MVHTEVAGFERSEFAFGGRTRTLYRAGSGPGVIVIAEIPGITPEVIGFAERLVDRGFHVVMPSLFGEPGAELSATSMLKVVPPVCVAQEFTAFAMRRTPKVIDWLRALAQQVHEECGGPGVGAVGMCFTGGFALAMATEPEMLAPVLSQPSLPIAVSRRRGADAGISDDDLLKVKERARDEGLCVLGLRFSDDRLSPGSKFKTLRRELGDNFIGVEIDSSPGNPWGHARTAHSVLTNDLIDEEGQPTRAALDQVLDFLATRLQQGGDEATS